jgi:rod shape-determining protein MreC
MENFFARYKNPLVLMAVLLIQVVALATQVKRQENGRAAGGGTRLIRVWTVTAFTPVEKMLVSTGHFFRNGWHNYVDLRNVRKQNKELQDQVSRLQMEQARLRQDADQARRLQALLEFKERFVAKTVAAQVIATSGTEQSRVVTIDKGSRNAGIKTDMAVITPDGIVGKVKEVFDFSSQVLMISDHDSGAGVILESSRLQGILKGSPSGELQINDVMSDEKVEAGEHVITSGGDRIFPKGLSVGTVISATPDRDNDPFLNIRVKPAADLRRLEEVLVVTKMGEEAPTPSGTSPLRAADILSQRLPSIPKQEDKTVKPGGPAATPAPSPGVGVNQPKPAGTNPVQNKPSTGTGAAANVAPAGAAPVKSPTPAGKPAVGVATGSVTTGSLANGTSANGKPSGTATAAGTATPSSSKPAVENKKPAGAEQPQSASGAATPTPTPKPKATPPKKPQTPATAPGASPSAPAKNPDQQQTPPAPTPTATPEREPR